MADKPTYRFRFQVEDAETGEVIGTDFCQLTSIDQFGGCESVDMHVASTLRWFERTGREQHERENYPAAETAEAE